MSHPLSLRFKSRGILNYAGFKIEFYRTSNSLALEHSHFVRYLNLIRSMLILFIKNFDSSNTDKKTVSLREMCRGKLTGSLINVEEQVMIVSFEVKARRLMKVFVKK